MNKQSVLLDRIGMCTSVICMAHCFSIPLFLLFGFDVVLRLIDQEWVESTIIVFTLIIGIASFLSGFLSHRQHFVPVLFIAGFLLLVNGESVNDTWISESLTVAGVLVITYAHVQNLKWKHYCKAEYSCTKTT